MSSDYYGSIAGEVADRGASAEAAFLEWLNDFARRERDTSYQDDLRAAFDAGMAHATVPVSVTTVNGPVSERQRVILRMLAEAGDRGLFPRDFAALYDPERPLENRLNNVRNNLRTLSMRGFVVHSEGTAGRNGYCWRITRKGLDWL